jgi:hypothetical protein
MASTDGFKGYANGNNASQLDPTSSVDIYEMENMNPTSKNKRKVDNTEIRHF